MRRACLGGAAHLVVVAPADALDRAHELARTAIPDGHRTALHVAAGGPDRVASVRSGLSALLPTDGVVLVHDAARALAPPELFVAVVAAVRAGHPAVVPGVPVADTIKSVDQDNRVTATLDRSALRAIQTPQGFLREELERAHAGGATGTDDASLVEHAGGRVYLIPGDHRADKITTPADLALAYWRLAAEAAEPRDSRLPWSSPAQASAP